MGQNAQGGMGGSTAGMQPPIGPAGAATTPSLGFGGPTLGGGNTFPQGQWLNLLTQFLGRGAPQMGQQGPGMPPPQQTPPVQQQPPIAQQPRHNQPGHAGATPPGPQGLPWAPQAPPAAGWPGMGSGSAIQAYLAQLRGGSTPPPQWMAQPHNRMQPASATVNPIAPGAPQGLVQ